MNFIVNKYQGNVKLLLIACDEDEQKFLESHIGEVVELHAAQHHAHLTPESLASSQAVSNASALEPLDR